MAALDSAYAAAAAVLVNSLISVNATICEGPVAAIPIVSKPLCSTYNDALSAAQAVFRSATSPANASYARQWAAIQSRYEASTGRSPRTGAGPATSCRSRWHGPARRSVARLAAESEDEESARRCQRAKRLARLLILCFMGLPDELAIAIFVPAGSVFPARGEVEITSPLATVAELFLVTRPTLQSSNLRIALACDRDAPFSDGT